MVNKKRRRLIQYMAILIVSLLFFINAVSAAAQSPKGRVLKVAFPELEGISETDEYGNHKGLFVDYLNEIAKYTGWEYEYIPVKNEDIVNNFIDGQYDIMGGTFYSPSFEEYFAYPNYDMCRSRAVLLCRKDDSSLLGYDLTSLNGKTIGVYENAKEKIRHLNEFLASNDLTCQFRYYSYDDMKDNGNLYQQLREGEVDMLLGNDLEIGGEFRMVTSFQAQPYYIVTTVGNTEILNGLNTALKHILESMPNFPEETYNANFPDLKSMDIQLSDDELMYISEKETITVAINKNWHPIYCQNNSLDHHEGILPDMIKEISSFTGLKFTYVYTDSYEESVKAVQQGKADILGAYLEENEQAFSEGLILSQSYISLNNIVLKHKSVSYPNPGLTGATLAGRMLPYDFEVSETRSYDTAAEMMDAVNTGDVDFVYGMSAMLEQEMQNHRYLNVVPVTQVSDNTNVSFAISGSAPSELLTILNKAVGNIPTNEKSAILNRNLVSVGYTSLSLQELIYANPVAFIVILGGALLIVTIGILLIVKSKMTNVLMQSQLEAAEAKSLAKSEFLSRMSHEIRTPMNAIIGLTDLACMEQNIPLEIEKKLKKIRSSSQYLLSLINDILDMSRIENGKMEIEQKNFSLTNMLDELQVMMNVQAEQNGLQFKAFCKIENDNIVGDAIRLRQVLTNLLSNAIKFTPEGGTVTLRVDEISCCENAVEYRFSVKDTGIGIPLKDQKRIFSPFEQVTQFTSQSAGTGLGLPISCSMVQLMGGELNVISDDGKGSEFYMTLCFPLSVDTPQTQSEYTNQNKSLEGIKILLAEDNNLNAEIAQELLSSQGIEVIWAANGQKAVDLFMASSPGEFQIILMDIQMPVKDGHEAACDIRSSGRPDSDVPIIAMTANSFKEDEEAAKVVGMNGFVPKPVDPNRLFSILRDML